MTSQADHVATLTAAADYLTSGASGEKGQAFLRWLGIWSRAEVDDVPDLVALLRFACRLERLFQLPVPDAPGLHAFGAEISVNRIDPAHDGRVGFSGLGVTRLEAFRSCVAEAVEHASQYGTARVLAGLSSAPAVSVGNGPYGARLDLGESAGAAIQMVELTLLEGGREPVPAALCFRNLPSGQPRPGYRIGIGCAAGRTVEAAAEGALLELAERDAVSLWWQGLRRGRPVAAETVAASGVSRLVETARQHVTDRRSWFLDITAEYGVPVIVAVSTDADGAGFAYGFGAGRSLGEALRPAFLELCQIELADRIVARKRQEAGAGALNPVDLLHERRRTGITADFDLLHPAGPPGRDSRLADIRDAFLSNGIAAGLLDMTRDDFQVPVCRAVSPDLQPYPAEFLTDRVRQESLANKKALRNHSDIPLA